MYNQIHQEQIVAGETTQNIVENPAVQEQVIVQEIPRVSIVAQVQEQTVEPIEVLPHELATQRTFKTNCARAIHPDPGAECYRFDEPAIFCPCCRGSTGCQFFSSLGRCCRTRVQTKSIRNLLLQTPKAQLIVQEIPESPIVERIQEQIDEPIEVLPHERVQQHTALQIVHVPVPESLSP